MTCLKAVDFFHTNLFNPLQALPTMKFLYIYLRNKFGSETVFNSWAADVKEMYDWLPQNDILKAIRWILSYVSKSQGETMLRCFLNAQNKAELENLINVMIQSISLLKIFF